jgi:hypothetical protein
MIVPPFTEDDNSRFPTMTHLYFDDHRVRREYALLLRLRQLAPPEVSPLLWSSKILEEIIPEGEPKHAEKDLHPRV